MEPTLYQWIHCRYGRPRFVEEHLKVLQGAFCALFDSTPALDTAALTAEIEQRTAAEGLPASLSVFVRVELHCDGALRIVRVEPSLYDGYALRSLHPTVRTLRYDHPFGVRWTTAAEAADRLSEEVARAEGADNALRCTADGRCLGLGAAPLFALHNRRVTTPEEPQTVEARLFVRAAERLGLMVQIAPIGEAELPRYEELLTVDHRGITALSACNGHPFIMLKSEQIAAEMERLVTAR